MKLSMNFLLLFILALVSGSCKKNAIEVFPKLAGQWESSLSCWDPCDQAYLKIDNEGNGIYQSSSDMLGQSTRYDGKVKLNGDNVLFVDGNKFYEIYEVKDTIGYYVLGSDCYCYAVDMDSVQFTKIMKTSNGLRYQFNF